nr:MAG TPA: hypothetical protein [Caudoviricetes sp.]
MIYSSAKRCCFNVSFIYHQLLSVNKKDSQSRLP